MSCSCLPLCCRLHFNQVSSGNSWDGWEDVREIMWIQDFPRKTAPKHSAHVRDASTLLTVRQDFESYLTLFLSSIDDSSSVSE